MCGKQRKTFTGKLIYSMRAMHVKLPMGSCKHSSRAIVFSVPAVADSQSPCMVIWPASGLPNSKRHIFIPSHLTS